MTSARTISLEVLDQLLAKVVEVGGSDLHIKAGAKPKIRVNGDLYAVKEVPAMSADETEQLVSALIPEHQEETFSLVGDADFAYAVPSLGRFRCSRQWNHP